MIDYFGCDVVVVYMCYVQDNVEEVVCWVIDWFDNGVYCYCMDLGVMIVVCIIVDCVVCSVIIDFIGILVQLDINFNVLILVVNVVVFYVFWILVVDDILFNDGCLCLLCIVVFEGLMFVLIYFVVVVVGNVEIL